MDSYAVLLQLVLGHSLGHSDNQRKNAVPFLLQEKGLGRFLGLGGNWVTFISSPHERREKWTIDRLVVVIDSKFCTV